MGRLCQRLTCSRLEISLLARLQTNSAACRRMRPLRLDHPSGVPACAAKAVLPRRSPHGANNATAVRWTSRLRSPAGPKPTPPNPLADEVARLRAEHAHVPARRDQAELVIDVQKNRGGNSCVQASEELRNMDKSSPRTPASRWRDVLFAPTEKNAHLPGQPTLPEHERSCAPPCPTWLR